jgi:hypothetical protein
MIGQQLNKDIPSTAHGEPAPAEDIVLGAKILKLAVAFDDLRMRPLSNEVALARLRQKPTEFAPALIDALASLTPDHPTTELRRLPVPRLATGMVLDQEIRNKHGMLLVAKGQEITQALLLKIGNYLRLGEIDRDVMVYVPVK